MAAGSLPAPGTEFGPCVDPCEHRDCAANRFSAATPCRICGELISYDRLFYNDEGGLVHALCLLAEIEK